MNLLTKKPFFKIKLEDIGKHITIQTGATFYPLVITELMVGLIVGQLYVTKRTGPGIHIKNRKSKKK